MQKRREAKTLLQLGAVGEVAEENCNALIGLRKGRR